MPSSIRRIFLFIFLAVALWPLRTTAQSGVAQIAITYLEAQAEVSEPVQVSARVSVLDNQGQPVTGLTANDFTLSENGQTIDRTQLTVLPATDPVAVTLLLDTSSPMAQPGPNGVRAIDSVKDAAIAFAEQMAQEDWLAVYEFNRVPDIRQDFTYDHNLSIDQGIVPLDARPDAPACFYDALKFTLETITENPTGPNIVVALTGNPQPGDECGGTTIDDLLDTTTPAGNSIPVFTVAFGSDVDEADLLRLGRRSGGYTWLVSDSTALADPLTALVTQLSRQYQINYNTQAGPGLTRVSIVENSAQQASHRQVVMPAPIEPTPTPPPQYTVGLSVEQSTAQMLVVRVTVPPDVELTRTELYLNSQLEQTLNEAPFDIFELDISVLGSGKHLIGVETVDINQVTAAAEVELTLTLPPTPEPTLSATSLPPDETASSPAEESGATLAVPALAVTLVGVGIVLLLVFLGVMAYLFFFRSKKDEGPAGVPPPIPPAPAVGPATLLDVGTPPPAVGPATLLDVDAPATVMSPASTPAPLPPVQAKLVVTAYHQLTSQPQFDLPTQAAIHIGRNTASEAVNQIPVQDKEVSRAHARITHQTGQYFIEDLNSTTGTSVNGTRLTPGQSMALQNGAEITIGLRIKFRLEITAAESGGDETLIDLNANEIRAKYEGQDPRRTLYD